MTRYFQSYTFYTIGTFFYRGILSGMFKGALGGILYLIIVYGFNIFLYPLYLVYLSVPIAIYAGGFGGLLGGIIGFALGFITLFTQSHTYYKYILMVTAAVPTFLFCYTWVSSVHTLYSATGDFDPSLPYVGATIGLLAAAHSAHQLADLQLQHKKKKQEEIEYG
jgi:hypothetical protein